MILLVEDRADDIFLVQKALAKAKVPNPFLVVRDGEEALAYLNGVGKYSNRSEFPLPDIMLLDLKLPRMDGFEVLSAVRSQPSFKALRIIVLTSSQDLQDVNRAYDLGANSFLVKPLEFENYPAMLRTLASFWLHHSRSPTIERPRNNQSSGQQAEGAGK